MLIAPPGVDRFVMLVLRPAEDPLFRSPLNANVHWPRDGSVTTLE